MKKIDRLREITFQLRKPFIKIYNPMTHVGDEVSSPLPSYSDGQLVVIAQSLIDAQIDPGDEVTNIETLPAMEFGVSLTWTEDSTSVSLEKGTVSLSDDMADTVVQVIPSNMDDYLQVSGEMFVLKTGENLLLRVA